MRRLEDDQDGRPAGQRRLLDLVRTFLRPYSRQLGVIAVLQVLQAVGNLYLPSLNADIINIGVIKADLAFLGRAGAVMLAISVALCGISVYATYLYAAVSMSVGKDIRAALYDRVQSFSVIQLNRFGIASLTTRAVNDVQQIQIFLLVALSVLLVSVLTMTGAVTLAVRRAPGLSPLLGITVTAMLAVTCWVIVRLLPMFRSVQVKTDGLNQVLREQISGVRVARAFLRTGWEADRFEHANAGLTDATLRAGQVFALVIPVVTGITNLASVGIFWFGGRLVMDGSLPIGNLSAFLLYIVQILSCVGICVNILVLLPRALASAERIQQVLHADPAVVDPRQPVGAGTAGGTAPGTVEFRHVTFGYTGSERAVLTDVTFAARPGQITAVLGGTGSGKTTLLTLIPRFLDVTGGTVLVDGIEARARSVEQLRAGIGLVPQTAFLFAGTVASNLRFGRPDATDDQLWRALETAQARDFVSGLTGQLEARIDRGGVNLSGGQRQRLSIARALVRRPSLYLFDDCFSALDAITDARLRAALLDEAGHAAMIIATQRASTVRHADQIVVLDAGTVAGVGSHPELLAGCRTYQEIVASQRGWGSAA